MKKILVFGMTKNPGGVESFIRSYYDKIDRTSLSFDFLCNFSEPMAYENEFKKIGSEIYHIPSRSQNYFKYKKAMKAFFEKNSKKYNAIWVNVCSLANIDYLIYSKKYGIKKRIIHSHNSQNMDSKIRGQLHQLNKRRLANYATDFWACSLDAALWFYTKKNIENCVIIKNAICLEDYLFNNKKRKTIREKLGVTNAYVIGNVGRLHFQKNQSFAIDIFNEFVSINPDSILVLVGQGEDEIMLKNKVKKLNLESKVIFAGVQTDICSWLSAFDCFLFPSQFEGLGIAALEAQANGVPVLASAEVIPKEVKINDNFIFLNLKEPPNEWAKQLNIIKKDFARENNVTISRNFDKNGYNIKTEVGKLQDLFMR